MNAIDHRWLPEELASNVEVMWVYFTLSVPRLGVAHWTSKRAAEVMWDQTKLGALANRSDPLTCLASHLHHGSADASRPPNARAQHS